MTVFEAFVGAVVVIAVAKAISYLRYRREIKKMAADFEKLLIDSFMSVILPVKAERHDDVIYFYKADSMEYLCHGKTRQELADAVEAKCPGMTVFVQDDCDREILKTLEIH